MIRNRVGRRIALAIWWAAVSLAGVTAALGPTVAQPSVAEARVKHLQHGINLSHWFAQAGGPANYTKEHFESLITVEDIALMKAMGFDHVR